MLSRDGESGVEVLICHRVESLPAFPGYWAFPGGGISRIDKQAVSVIPALSEIKDSDWAASLAGMLRELVEEMGWTIEKGQLKEVNPDSRNAVLKDKAGWLEEVESGRLPCDWQGITQFGQRTTPNFAPLRFNNRFLHFHAGSFTTVPEPILAGQTEFDDFRWATPAELLAEWRMHEIKLPPPIVTILAEVEELMTESADMRAVVQRISETQSSPKTILFAHGVECVPVPTHTLPPATTTNTYLLGHKGGEHLLVDPAAKTAAGLALIAQAIERVEAAGGQVAGILFTHRHLDHVGDIAALQDMGPFPIMASAETAAALPVAVDVVYSDGDQISLPAPEGPQVWAVLITPGHCPGHICLEGAAGIVAGDMVAGIGTILIPPEEGRMEEYLRQLSRMKDIEPHILFPSHGPMLPLPQKTLGHYLKHRRARHDRVLQAVRSGIDDLSLISAYAYSDSPDAHPVLARQQTLSHLLSHQRNGTLITEKNNWKLQS